MPPVGLRLLTTCPWPATCPRPGQRRGQTSASDPGRRPTATAQLHHADTAVAHPRARPNLRRVSIGLGTEGAVPGVLMLVAAAPMALPVTAVRALATVNNCSPGHEVLVHIPRTHHGIVERQACHQVSVDIADILFCPMACPGAGMVIAADLASWTVMSTSQSRRFPVTVTHLPVTRRPRRSDPLHQL